MEMLWPGQSGNAHAGGAPICTFSGLRRWPAKAVIVALCREKNVTAQACCLRMNNLQNDARIASVGLFPATGAGGNAAPPAHVFC
jgi:hypothetical protein